MKCIINQRLSVQGSALLIVMAFITIVAVLLLAFLVSSERALKQSDTSAAILKTRLLGEVALGAVVEDFQAEMRAGSVVSGDNDIPMRVVDPWTMVPGRVLKESGMLDDPDFTNLIKQSVSGQPFFPGNNPANFSAVGLSRASALSSATPSRNGRLVSAERWNKPKLLGGAAGLAGFSPSQLPDWIYITRNGASDSGSLTGNASDSNPTNANYVIGRFAYNIYDIGGLLDINVAGFNPSDPASRTAAEEKGSLAWADLSAIPGLNSPTLISSLVEWRNKEGGSDYPAMVQGRRPGEGSTAVPQPWGEPGGFRRPYTTGAQSDNRFFSRQDLLKYFETQLTGAETALPFLATFSADRDQPSFFPHPARPRVTANSADGGNDASGLDDLYNPYFLEVTDGEGEPIVKRRFPLERLKYVVPNPAEPEMVRRYFGLEWNDADYAWVYVGGGTSPETYIDLLGDIADATPAREPNFFELLMAAIHVGSLGQQFERGEDADPLMMSPRAFGRRDGSVFYHIIQIGAAIIDQYDADSYPTRIFFNGELFVGVEDIPYLYGVRTVAYRQQLVQASELQVPQAPQPEPGTGRRLPYRGAAMVQPEIWNPTAPSTAPFNGPTEFRVGMTANNVGVEIRRSWWTGTSGYVASFPSTNPLDSNLPRSFLAEADYVSFRSRSNGDDLFREPYTLKSPNFPPGSNAAGTESASTISLNEMNDIGEESDVALGFQIGTVWLGPVSDSSTNRYLSNARETGNGYDLELRYRAPDGRYILYDRMPRIPPNTNLNFDDPSDELRRPRTFTRTDPRSDRLNYQRYLLSIRGTGSGAGIYFPQGSSLRPSSGNGRAGTLPGFNPGDPQATKARWVFPGGSSAPWNLVSDNMPGSEVRYADPDRVLRRAMGGYAPNPAGDILGLPMARGNYASRPVILNRPFTSVAELGYAFRGIPWKQIDFWNPESGDAALLDVFCLYEPAENASPIVAGRVNINTQRPEVLEALLRGVTKESGVPLSNGDAANLSKALTDWTKQQGLGRGPLRNRAEIVGRYDPAASAASGYPVGRYAGFSARIRELVSGEDRALQRRQQSILRALTDATTARTWSFLIDLIVQEGNIPAGEADEFVVRGETRMWIHLAMDRFTGEVIGQLVEAVNE